MELLPISRNAGQGADLQRMLAWTHLIVGESEPALDRLERATDGGRWSVEERAWPIDWMRPSRFRFARARTLVENGVRGSGACS